MRFSIAAATAALAALTEARVKVTGISVPSTIKPGDGFNLAIECSDWMGGYDVGIAIGYAAAPGYPGALGSVIGSYNIFPEQCNYRLGNFKKWVTLPADAPKGKAVISAAVMGLYGAGAAPTLTVYNVAVTFGDSTSLTYVSSSP